MRELRNVARAEAHVARICDQEQQAAARHEQSVRKQAARTCDARRREAETQQRKQQTAQLAEQQRITWRANVLP